MHSIVVVWEAGSSKCCYSNPHVTILGILTMALYLSTLKIKLPCNLLFFRGILPHSCLYHMIQGLWLVFFGFTSGSAFKKHHCRQSNNSLELHLKAESNLHSLHYLRVYPSHWRWQPFRLDLRSIYSFAFLFLLKYLAAGDIRNC